MEFVNRIRIEALRSQESFQLGKFERTLLIPGTQSKFDIHYPESFVRLILFEPSRFRARPFPNSVNLDPWKVFPPSTFIRLFRYSFVGSVVWFVFHRDHFAVTNVCDAPLAFYACAVYLEPSKLFERRIGVNSFFNGDRGIF